MVADGDPGFANPLAALRVLETALDALRDLMGEMDKRHDLQFGDLQSQIDRRFHHAVARAQDSVASLDRLVDQRFNDSDKALQAAMSAADKAVQAALNAAKEAVEKAEIANQKRFDEIAEKFITFNEFRGQLSDQAQMFMPRAEAEIRFTGLAEKIEANTRYIDRTGGGNQTGQRLTGTIISIASVLIAVGSLVALTVLH